MPKRATVNVEVPLEFTLFTPTYRVATVNLAMQRGRLEWQLQHLCAGVWSCQNVPP